MLKSRALLLENHLRDNIAALKKSVPAHTHIMPMIKANAYGHSDVLLAARLSEFDIRYVGVAHLEEVHRVVAAGFKGHILCLGSFSYDDLKDIPPRTLLTLHHLDEIKCLHALPSEKKRSLDLHVEFDTGMNRMGFKLGDLPLLFSNLGDLTDHISAAFSHFSESEQSGSQFSHQQDTLFQSMFDSLEKHCRRKLKRHIANSGGLFHFPDKAYDFVRPGIAFYGYPTYPTPLSLKPILEWRAPVVALKDVLPGESISYNRTFTADKKMRIATLAVGYGDGYLRSYASVGVALHEQRCPTLGRICMDYTMIDVSHLKSGIKLGDEAILIHSDAEIGPTAEDLAKASKTISYEILTSISQRVTRMWQTSSPGIQL